MSRSVPVMRRYASRYRALVASTGVGYARLTQFAHSMAVAFTSTMLVSAAAGTSFQSRTTAGGLSTSVGGGSTLVAPEWLKIVRAGNVISGYQSGDGINWKLVGKAAIPLGPSVSIGLAVTSHDNAKVAGATFESVVR